MATNTGSIVQPVENGKLVDTTGNNALSNAKESGGTDSLDKEAFMQLLVAQMKYQDPLEPTSNTEYISQLATFSSLEQMQNLNSSMKEDLAASLVGKQVVMRTTNTLTGTTTYASGTVDYVQRENGKTYLSVDNGLYPIEDLDMVVNSDYLDAVTLADTFEAMMKSLPNKYQLSISDKNKLELARKAYDSMTDYQKGFVNKQYVDLLKELEAKMKELELANGGGDTDGDGDSSGGDGGSGGSGGDGGAAT